MQGLPTIYELLSWRRSEFLLSVVGSTLKSRQDTSSGLFV